MKLHIDDVALLMIDIQERLLPSIDGNDAVVKNAARLLKTVGTFSLPLLYTEQYPKGIGTTVRPLMEALPEGALRFEKTAFSCFDESGFSDEFEKLGRSTIAIFGIESHICVLSTVADLLARHYQVVVVADACGSRVRENHHLAMTAARQMGAFVFPAETVIYQMIGKAGTPEFKALLPLFK